MAILLRGFVLIFTVFRKTLTNEQKLLTSLNLFFFGSKQLWETREIGIEKLLSFYKRWFVTKTLQKRLKGTEFPIHTYLKHFYIKYFHLEGVYKGGEGGNKRYTYWIDVLNIFILFIQTALQSVSCHIFTCFNHQRLYQLYIYICKEGTLQK